MTRPDGTWRVDRARIYFRTAAVLTLGLFALAIVFYGMTEVAKAQGMRCGPYERIVKLITGPKHNEVKIASGLSGHNKMEVFANLESGSWTMVARLPNGFGCWVAAGKALKFHKIKPAEPDPA